MMVGRVGRYALGVVALLWLGGCSADTGAANEPAIGPLRALVSVERNESAIGSGGERQASAVAHFAKLPPHMDEREVLAATGLEPEALSAGECAVERLQGAPESSGATGGASAPVELLDAGDVYLQADGTPAVDLAPLAFPAVNGLSAGVVYATRNRLASPFPAGARYTLTTTGSADLERPIRITALAPENLSGVLTTGSALETIDSLAVSADLQLAWDGVDPDDLVIGRVFNDAAATFVVCAFPDDQAAGTIPRQLLGALPPGPGRLVVTRTRTREVASEDLDLVRMRFEFSLTRQLDLVP